MTVPFQVTIDCADPDRMTRFWSVALGYRVEEPPAGFADWDAYWRSVGVPEEELGGGDDRLVDPTGTGPPIWFQIVPEPKVAKNRIHLDLKVSGGRDMPIETRRERVDAEVDRLIGAGATRLRVSEQEGLDHYGVVMQDPEGNEFCIG